MIDYRRKHSDQSNDIQNDSYEQLLTFILLLEDSPLLSWVCFPEADVRRAGRGSTGWLRWLDEGLDHASDESEMCCWWLRRMAIAAASAGGAREKAVNEAKMATNTNLGVRRSMSGKQSKVRPVAKIKR